MKARQCRAALECVEDVACAVDVDPDSHLTGHRQVVRSSEMPRLGDSVEGVCAQTEAGLRDVALDKADSPLQRGVDGAELGDMPLSQYGELGLHQAHRRAIYAPQDPG